MNFQIKTNMTCQHCIMTVTPFLNAVESIDSWRVDLSHPDKLLFVELDDDNPEPALEAVKNAGFEAQLLEDVQ